MPRKHSVSPSLQVLETRDVPAYLMSFGGGELRITFDNNAGSAQSVQVSAVNGHVTLNDHATNVLATNVKAITVVGSDLNNTIDLRFVSTGTGFRKLDGHVTLSGNGGDDVLIGSQFADSINGGAGFDQLYGGDGNDTVDGGAGDDWLYPGYGNDTIIQTKTPDWCDRLEPGDRVIRR